MFQIINKDRQGSVRVLPTIYPNHHEADYKVREYASILRYFGASGFSHSRGLSIAHFPDGSQEEYWRGKEEVLQTSIPIF